ncbi:MAG: hypothetical protein HDT25_04680 [Ruminococcus sp.]|nr:hypothetical protein [Ruminococcus sp.]
MKICKKTLIALCIILPILVFAAGFILYVNQQPNFSKYHSYSVVTDNGGITLTDEQFKQIVDIYKNDKTSYRAWGFDNHYMSGYDIKLYETDDMSGDFVYMITGSNGKGGNENGMALWIGHDCFPFENPNTANMVNDIIEEAINCSERK